jgi:hypothetical protein
MSGSKTMKKPKKTKKRTTRTSPIESATLFPVGTIKMGLDGKQWIIAITSTGVKRWVHHILDTYVVQSKDDVIIFFDVDKIIPKLKLGRIKKIGSLDITGNQIGVGELWYHSFKALTGKYNIYYYRGSLIAVHENETIKGQKFKITDVTFFCDFGSFAFNDARYIKQVYKVPKPRNVTKSIKAIYDVFPAIDMEKHWFFRSDRRIYEYTYIYDVDLDINKGNPTADKSNPIAIFADNGYGDGSAFPIYQGKNAFWIMSPIVYSKIFDLILK